MCTITNKFNILNETTGILLCPMQFVHALYVAIVPFLRNKKICNSLHGLVLLYSMEPWSQADHIMQLL